MHKLATVGGLLVFATNFSVAQTIDQFSSSFVESMTKECKQTQRADAQNAKMTDSQIAQYCSCVSRHSVEVVTMPEVFELARTGERPKTMQQKLNALGTTCVEVLLGKTRDGPIKR